MDSDTVISLRGVGKRFRLRHTGTRTLKSAVMECFSRRGPAPELWALKDIHFDVKRGETLGIIGANGAGKSTLMSIMAGTLQPTEGSMTRTGSLSSLLELGAGFHPDLTGRENVFLWGAILGLTQAQMRARFDAIVAFSELERFIDQPVKHYSSGMYVRLGFAVAVEVDPEILLVDEVLAVGDVAFQRKCIDRMEQFRRRGKTLVIISHDMGAIQLISDRILLLDAGRILDDGLPGTVVARYQEFMKRHQIEGLNREWGTREVVITGVEFRNGEGRESDVYEHGSPLEVRIHYEAARRIESPVFGYSICDERGRQITGNNTQLEGFRIPVVEGKGSVSLWFDRLPLLNGRYLFSFSTHSWDHTTNYHRLDNTYAIKVLNPVGFEGYCYVPCRWALGNGQAEQGKGPPA